MGLLEAVHGHRWGEAKIPPSQNLSHISCKDENGHSYRIPKEYPKNI